MIYSTILQLHDIRINKLSSCNSSNIVSHIFTFQSPLLHCITNASIVNLWKLVFPWAAFCRKFNKMEAEICCRSQKAPASLDERVSKKDSINPVNIFVSFKQLVKHRFTMTFFRLWFTDFSVDGVQFQDILISLIFYLIFNVVAFAIIVFIFGAWNNASPTCHWVNLWLSFAFVCLFTRCIRPITSGRILNFLKIKTNVTL